MNKEVISQPGQKKPCLNEVSFMRPVLLVLLVSYHAFAPYVGSWDLPEGIGEINAYKIIGLLSRAFLLEGFVFISGYIFTFQLIERHKFDSFRSLFFSKLQRLLIPSFVFSALYILFFLNMDNPVSMIVKVIEGAGHLWYLPCLFWLFLLQYAIIKADISKHIVFLLLFAGVLLAGIPLPMQLNNALYYFMFFSGGGIFWRFSSRLKSKGTIKKVILSWAFFVVMFVMMNALIRYNLHLSREMGNPFMKEVFLAFNRLSKAALAWSGIYALYITAVLYCRMHELGQVIIKIGACGYGVYVFHQFILKWLYGYTQLPDFAGTYMLPWLALVITTLLSVTLTLLVRQTKIGRRYL